VSSKSWDKGLEFSSARSRILELLIQAHSACLNGGIDDRYSYLAVMLTQLDNGCRVGEACAAVQQYIKTGERRLSVRVEKRRDKEHRLVIVPLEVELAALDERACAPYRVKNFASRMGMNTHSLRYAFITRLATEGVNPAVIAKVTGHKSLNTLLHYIQKREAEAVLTHHVNGAGDGK